MQLCGVPLQEALKAARMNVNALTKNWVAPGRLVNRLALQHCLPGGLTAGQVYQSHAGYIANTSKERLVGRLLFLQHHGLLHLLVASKREWRWQRSLPAHRPAPGEPPLISLRDVSRPDEWFTSLPAVQAAGGPPALQAFTAGLKSSPAWQELHVAAEAEQARLLALLPEELQQAANKRQAGKR
ncbi:hypothetical protein ABPG75_003667 [Micractinium tetrahymenae]